MNRSGEPSIGSEKVPILDFEDSKYGATEEHRRTVYRPSDRKVGPSFDSDMVLSYGSKIISSLNSWRCSADRRVRSYIEATYLDRILLISIPIYLGLSFLCIGY